MFYFIVLNVINIRYFSISRKSFSVSKEVAYTSSSKKETVFYSDFISAIIVYTTLPNPIFKSVTKPFRNDTIDELYFKAHKRLHNTGNTQPTFLPFDTST